MRNHELQICYKSVITISTNCVYHKFNLLQQQITQFVIIIQIRDFDFFFLYLEGPKWASVEYTSVLIILISLHKFFNTRIHFETNKLSNFKTFTRLT